MIHTLIENTITAKNPLGADSEENELFNVTSKISC